MGKYVVVAETGADVPKDYAERYGIYIVPMHVTFDDVVKDDGSFPQQEVCDYYNRTGKVPKTAASNPEDFTKVFDEIFEKYPDCYIFYMAYSAVTTSSFQSGVIAADGHPRIFLYDTKQVTIGQGAAAIRLAQQIEENPDWTVDKVKEAAEKIIKSMNFWFTPSNLDYLRAGGRVSNATALCGNLLSIHPRIEIIDGYLKATKKYRGKMDKVVMKMVDDFVEENNLEKDEIWAGGTVGLSEDLKQSVKDALLAKGFKKVNLMTCGCVITTHGGPNAFGICGFTK